MTEAFVPEAADEVGRRATAGGRRSRRHGDRGVFQSGMTNVMTWGDGALMIRGQVDVKDVSAISRLVHGPKPPRPARG